MQAFDSSKVEIKLSPREVENLLDQYFGTFSHATHDQITDLALAYSEHSRLCALLARGWEAMVEPWKSVFALVTDADPCDAMWYTTDTNAELIRRFSVAVVAIETVKP
jgi:hypothetical protein